MSRSRKRQWIRGEASSLSGKRRMVRRPFTESLERRDLLATIVSMNPAAFSHSAPTSTNVAATFDENISAATQQSFRVHSMQRGQLVGAEAAVSITDATVELDPAADFFAGEIVKVTATSAIQGSTPVVPRVWDFRIGATGSGVFGDSGQTTLAATYKNRLGDLDGDGDLDAFVLRGDGSTHVTLNDGNGVFTTTQSLGNFSSYDAKLGDLDGDGDLDAIATGEIYSSDRIWLNDGSGQFSAGQLLGNHASLSVELGDLDGDGDLDAYIGTRETNRVWLNGGNANFTDTNQAIGNNPTRKATMGDVDLDGDLDLLSGNPDNPDSIFLNNGNAVFTDSGQMLGGYNSRAVYFGDVDGDGDPDLVIVHTDTVPNQVWLNDGSGIFTDSGQRLGNHDTWGLGLGDLDGDGDLDIIGGNVYQDNRLWLNDGGGVFSDSGETVGSGDTRNIELGDLDGDGDLDAYVGHQYNPSEVWLNQNLTPSVALSVDNTIVPENGGAATVTATLSEVHTEEVTVDLGFSGSATETADYTASSAQIMIPVGETTGSITLTAVQDPQDEPDETVVIDITNITNGQAGGPQQVTVTIQDDDEAPIPDVTLTANPVEIPEAGGESTFTAILSEVTSLPVTVDLAVAGSSTATPATDYALSGSQITIPPGATSGSVTATAVQDTLSEPPETITLEITGVTGGNEDGEQAATTTIVDDDAPPTFVVSDFAPTSTGFTATLSAEVDTSVLNLFDTETGGMGPADVVVQGDATGPLLGSLVVDSSGRTLTFIATGDRLEADTYTVTMRSADNGWKDTDGNLLDGDADGTAGADFSDTFTVAASTAVELGLPDFTRGPGQAVEVPHGSAGLPITINEGTAVRSATLSVDFDENLLSITGATVGANMPAGATVDIDTSVAGRAIISFTSPTDLPAGSNTLVDLQAMVPATDASLIYGNRHVLDINVSSLTNGAGAEVPAIDNDAVHVAAFMADVSGNGQINATDASQTARIAVFLDGGLASFLTVDPLVIADVSGNGAVNAADASQVARVAALIPVPGIPPIPAGVVIAAGGGGAPRIVARSPLAIVTPLQLASTTLHIPLEETFSSRTHEDGQRPTHTAVDTLMTNLSNAALDDAGEDELSLTLEDSVEELLSTSQDPLSD